MIEQIISWWDSIVITPFQILEQSKILFWLVLGSFTIITTKTWIDERRIKKKDFE